MVLTCKTNEAQAREALRAFWAGESLGRPALHITVHHAHPECDWCGWDMRSKRNDFDPSWHILRAERQLVETEYLAEAMPGIVLEWGSLLTTMTSLLGFDYVYHSDSAWTLPVEDLYERPLPQFDPHTPVVRAWEACYRQMAAAVGQRGYLNPPIMLDGMTVLSNLRTPRGLCLEVLERRTDVCRWAKALTALYIEGYEHFYQLVCTLGYGDASSWLWAMAEGRVEAVQCDFAIMLSPHLFGELVMPSLRRLTNYFDFSLHHLDGVGQMRFLDRLATLPRLNGIQWNPEPPAGSPLGWIEALRAIRAHGLILHVGCQTVEEAVGLTRALGPDGLLLALPPFDSVGAAEAAITAIQRAC